MEEWSFKSPFKIDSFGRGRLLQAVASFEGGYFHISEIVRTKALRESDGGFIFEGQKWIIPLSFLTFNAEEWFPEIRGFRKWKEMTSSGPAREYYALPYLIDSYMMYDQSDREDSKRLFDEIVIMGSLGDTDKFPEIEPSLITRGRLEETYQAWKDSRTTHLIKKFHCEMDSLPGILERAGWTPNQDSENRS